MDKEEYRRKKVKLGGKLYKARVQAGYLQSDPVFKDVVTQSQLSKFENGDLMVNLFTLVKLASIYNVSILYFIEDDN